MVSNSSSYSPLVLLVFKAVRIISTHVSVPACDMSDAETSRAPCGTCDRSVLWTDKGVACESCGLWFHASCQYIGSRTYYNDLNNSDVTWHCVICGNINHSLVAFDHDVGGSSSTLSVPVSEGGFAPNRVSTQTKNSSHRRQGNRPLRLLNVNFHSAVGKRAEIANLIVSTKPDIVVGTETWLDNTISNAELFPAEYSIYRNDRNRNGGGVLIAVKNDIQCAELPELDVNGELIWIRIIKQCGRHVLVCAFYRPDVSDEAGLQMLVASLQRVA